MFYAKVLGKTLKDALRECVEQPDAELLSLREELGMMRILALDACALYNAVAENDKATHEQRLAAGQIVRDLLKDVAAMCEKAASVNGLGKDKISLQNIVLISNQLVHIAHDVFGEDPRVHRFQQLIEEKVRVPRDDNGMTNITPDMDVLEMDATIPKQENADEPGPRSHYEVSSGQLREVPASL